MLKHDTDEYYRNCSIIVLSAGMPGDDGA